MVNEGTWQHPAPQHQQHFEPSFLLRNHLMMDPCRRTQTPSPDKVSSAADAMLKLASTPHMYGGPPPPHQHGGPPPAAMYPPPPAPRPPPAQQAPVALVTNPHDLTSADTEINGDLTLSHVLAATSMQRIARKQREFTPDYKKDESYWIKRRKNNEAAKRSREKRRFNDIAMGSKILDLSSDNDKLRRELRALKRKFGLPVDIEYVDETMEDEPPSSPTGSNHSYSRSMSVSSGPTSPNLSSTTTIVFKEVKGLERSTSQPAMMPPMGSPNHEHYNDEYQGEYQGDYRGEYQDEYQGEYPPYSQPCESPQSASPSSLAYSSSPSSASMSMVTQQEPVLEPPPPMVPETAEDDKPLERSRERKGIPHKLRHKEQFQEHISHESSEAEQSPTDSGRSSSTSNLQGSEETSPPSTEEVEEEVEASPEQQQPEEEVLEDEEEEDDMDTSDSHTSGEGQEALRMSDRRRRAAHVQARRNRQQNRKMMSNMQLTKSQLLESENSQLKEELRHLASEVQNLKEWMTKKSGENLMNVIHSGPQ